MKKPLKPLPTDCCGSGCFRCVYEIYEEQIIKYKQWKEAQDKVNEETNSEKSL